MSMPTIQNDCAGVPDDPIAFRVFYRAAVQHLFPHALRFTRDAKEAEELCQMTLVRAYLHRRSFQPERGTSVFGWLWTVMKNLALTQHDRRKRFGEVAAQFAVEHPLAGRDAEENPESLAISAERSSRVRAALAALPEPFRDTLTRYYYNGETCEQIAAALGTPINTICTRLLRGRQKLRALLTAPTPSSQEAGVFVYPHTNALVWGCTGSKFWSRQMNRIS